MAMVPWRGIGCCLSAAALCLLGRTTGRDVDILKSVNRVNQLRELAQLLDEEILPLVVAISGRAGSETPISCEFSGLRGVILEETAEQHFLKHNDAGSWIQDSALMQSRSNEVPWYLMLGVKRIERVLPVGTSLTVVGEAAKDDVGTIRIQRPSKGPFYVSPKTIDELIANLGRWARWYKCTSAGLTVLGVYMIANHAIRYIMERRRRNELEKRVLAAAAKISGQDNGGEMDDSLSDGAKRERAMPNLCVICLEQEYNSVFVPCGHMCCCTACSSHLTSCPLCRRQIEKAVKTFRH